MFLPRVADLKQEKESKRKEGKHEESTQKHPQVERGTVSLIFRTYSEVAC